MTKEEKLELLKNRLVRGEIADEDYWNEYHKISWELTPKRT